MVIRGEKGVLDRMKRDLKILIDFDMIDNTFCIGGNVKLSRIHGIILDFLRSQIGAGADDSNPEKHGLYKIDIFVPFNFFRFCFFIFLL